MPYKVTFTVTEPDGREIKGDVATVDNRETAEQEIKDILELVWNAKLRPGDKPRTFKEITSVVAVPEEDDFDGDDMYDDEDDFGFEEDEEYDFNFNDD